MPKDWIEFKVCKLTVLWAILKKVNGRKFKQTL